VGSLVRSNFHKGRGGGGQRERGGSQKKDFVMEARGKAHRREGGRVEVLGWGTWIIFSAGERGMREGPRRNLRKKTESSLKFSGEREGSRERINLSQEKQEGKWGRGTKALLRWRGILKTAEVGRLLLRLNGEGVRKKGNNSVVE